MIRGLLINALADITGCVAAVLVGQPLDTVKVKMQLFPKNYSGMFSCLRKTVKTQHVRGLYAGTGPALMSCCANNTILFGAYSRCQLAIASLKGCGAEDLNWTENAVAGGASSVCRTGGFTAEFRLIPSRPNHSLDPHPLNCYSKTL
ncbi:mitochondrial ornithine transporter 2-like [Sipha flava]|uniref:Mitochondrial ornithine transporter 2-like n=1 Tax=Sipha flava TaxID=143950 RepID=A0A8B8FT44_9HEMI|nr:mitochondrial ornithine transporter 2-like [Sipha flava]